MSIETQRAEFEAFAKIRGLDLRREPDGLAYESAITREALFAFGYAQSSQAAEIEALKAKLSTYEAHGVTCQTFGHVVGACAECNTHEESKEAS